jgi:uncharacterized protein YpmB
MKKSLIVILTVLIIAFAGSIFIGCDVSCETVCSQNHTTCVDDARIYISNTALYNAKIAECEAAYQSCVSSCN